MTYSSSLGLRTEDLESLQKSMNYQFQNPELLGLSLLHRSVSNNGDKKKYASSNNERLEFLGDAVLDLVMSDILIHQFPDETEGDLTKKRASLVNEYVLNCIALDIGLDTYIQLGKAEQENGMNKNPRLLSSCLEAVLGAIYLDGGYEAVKVVVANLLQTHLENVKVGKSAFDDYKTQLQELLQKKYHGIPEYHLVKTEGPEHQKVFIVDVLFNGNFIAQAKGKNKKMAEQNAAKKALEVGYEL